MPADRMTHGKDVTGCSGLVTNEIQSPPEFAIRQPTRRHHPLWRSGRRSVRAALIDQLSPPHVSFVAQRQMGPAGAKGLGQSVVSLFRVLMKPYDPVLRVSRRTNMASSHWSTSVLALMMQQCGVLFWTTKVQAHLDRSICEKDRYGLCVPVIDIGAARKNQLGYRGRLGRKGYGVNPQRIEVSSIRGDDCQDAVGGILGKPPNQRARSGESEQNHVGGCQLRMP